MIQNSIIKKLCWLSIIIWLFWGFPRSAQAQKNTASSQVYLSFRYRGIVNQYVKTYYKDQQFYLPVVELFEALKINYTVDPGSFRITGTYPGNQPFSFDFKQQTARAGNTKIHLQAGRFLIRKTDYFIKPNLFKKLFGLKFITDFNNLSLGLETEHAPPVVAWYQRKQKREQLNNRQPLYKRSHYPLKYGRRRNSFTGGYLDYNVSGIYSGNKGLFTFSSALGAEMLGGDLQGNVFGVLSSNQHAFNTNNLRWRYVQLNDPYFSNIIVGETNTSGIANRSITGIKISNKPVQPRFIYGRYAIDGTVTPQSEVELYFNNQLINYQKANEAGYYRFMVPLTYGSTNYSVRIYTPSGRTIRRNKRIRIPFDYLPAGEIDYTVSGGRLRRPVLGLEGKGYIGSGSVSAGFTNWLTGKISSEYLTGYQSRPTVTGTLNARLFSNYLISANVNSARFYRLTSSVVYPGGASWRLSYDYNPGRSMLYDIGAYDHQARFNLFAPLHIGSLPLNFRLLSTYQRTGALAGLLRYRADVSTRLGRVNARLEYQDVQTAPLSLRVTPASRLMNGYIYSVGHFRNIPSIFRGLFIRGDISYLPRLHKLEQAELQLSRSFRQRGRIQLTFNHNFINDFNSMSLNITVNLHKTRSNTSTRIAGSQAFITQNFRGSIGYDPADRQFLLNNHHQVGQAGAAVRLFVDRNNDGIYQPDTDKLINKPAVHVSQSGGQTRVKNGINYISQMLPYYQYDIQISREALDNPLLIPSEKNFSIITDPNHYKLISIPFYQSGVISGKVEEQKNDSTSEALSGVRLFLVSSDTTAGREPFRKKLRTFSDGSFYAYKIPPGRYKLYIDPNQLQFLHAVARPDTMQFRVKAKARGDYVEGLNFKVIPKRKRNTQSP